jgi:lysophospholipase L1-like esterase
MKNGLLGISLSLNIVIVGFFLYSHWESLSIRKEPGVMTYGSELYRKDQVELHALYHSRNVATVMLGDSLTYGADWAELLRRRNVVNRGIIGDTTNGVLKRIDKVLGLNPKVCFIMIGINDLLRGADVNSVFRDYQQALSKLRERGISPVIQSTLFVSFVDKEKTNEKVATLNGLLRDYAKRNGVEYIDLNSVLGKDGYLATEYTYDGVHLSAKGYIAWKTSITPIVHKLAGTGN